MVVSRWLFAFLLALAAVAGGACWLQLQTGAQLREEVALLREEHVKLEQLRQENAALSAAQLPAPELARLRADREAVVQLRAEIEKLKDGIEERERALKAPATVK